MYRPRRKPELLRLSTRKSFNLTMLPVARCGDAGAICLGDVFRGYIEVVTLSTGGLIEGSRWKVNRLTGRESSMRVDGSWHSVRGIDKIHFH
jgi:hypothetical protein